MTITWLIPALAVSPQIQVSDLAGLKTLGFRAIVNNRPDSEVPDQPKSVDLEAEALRLGMDYAYLPITPGEMTDHDVVEFARALHSADGPVLAFCRTGARSTSLWKRVQELQSGKPKGG
jgi:sulfide:quinone oxidoreductase